MSTERLILSIIVMAAVTALLRFLPFLIFGGKRKTPKALLYLGNVLPCAVMGMLVIYCFKDISFSAVENYLPQFIAGAITVVLYLIKKNSLLSIVGGTASYMLLLHFVF